MKVYCFVADVLNRLTTMDMFGTKSNKKKVMHAVGLFIRRGRYEKFYISDLMKGIKISDIPWLSSAPPSDREAIMTKLLSWLLIHLVMDLLKAHFYITDTSMYRNRLFYYRKRVWRHIQQRALTDYKDKRYLKHITKDEANRLVMSKSSLGVAHLRFLPKSSSLRPIVNMGRPYTTDNKVTIPAINRQLQPILSILSYEKEQDPASLGSSVLGNADIYKAWNQFLSTRRRNDDKRPLYFVKVDLEGCYDSIDQNKLVDIIQCQLKKSSHSCYVLRRYSTVLSSGNVLQREFRRHICPLDKFSPNFVKFVREQITEKSLHGTIFVDQVLHDHETSDNIMRMLRAHLCNNIIKIGTEYYIQTEGLSQGSTLSGILCNYYYGHMERAHLDVKQDELLMRLIDDFLFVTPHRENAESFLRTMMEGITEYRCKVNPSKTLTNFNVTDYDVAQLPPQALFPWCGMLIDPITQEIRADYTRYDGLSVHDIFTMEVTVSPGVSLQKKLYWSLKTKCQGLFFDGQINTRPVLIENAFKMFLLAAYKFHSYYRQLPFRTNIKFLHELIKKLPIYFWFCLTKKLNLTKDYPLDISLIRIICYKSFLIKFRMHGVMYKSLIKKLQHIDKIEVEDLPTTLPEDFKLLMQ